MTKRKNLTRSALFTSILSLLLCVSMLVGTTFAWFTDEVVTGMNTIAAGNLDVELLASGASVDSTTELFDDVTLWEPGVVVYENLQVVNKGTLALKYQMSLNFGNENELDGHKLSEVLKISVVDKIADGATRQQVLEAAKASANVGTLQDFYVTGELEAGQNDAEQAVVIFWEPNDNTTDNLYNANNGQTTSDEKPLHIEFGVKLEATQLMHEEDSFGNDYDNVSFAPNYSALVDMRGESSNYILTSDLIADDYIYFGDNTNNTISLNGKTLTAENKNQWLLVGQGANCTLTIDGTGTVNANKGIFASSSGTVNLNGGTYQLGETSEKAHLYSQNSATIVINDGTYISEDPNSAIVYCINGFIEINGGFFQNTANPNQALLNMGNNLKYVDNQKITLRGGTFVNWNPMDSAFARPWTNPDVPALIVLAEGYKMISETQANGDVWYSVVPA